MKVMRSSIIRVEERCNERMIKYIKEEEIIRGKDKRLQIYGKGLLLNKFITSSGQQSKKQGHEARDI